MLTRIPVLAPEFVEGGVLLPADGHIEVHELLWSYLRGAAQGGAERCCGVSVRAVRTEGGRVSGVSTSAGDVDAPWVVDAAGAWAGVVAAGAGATPIPLSPCRRTIITFDAPPDLDVSGWPLVEHDAQQLYFAPESGGLFASPMDEEPLVPCDATADELAIATAAERVARVAPGSRRAASAAPGRACVRSRLTACSWSARIRGYRGSSGWPATAAAASRPAAPWDRSPPIC